MDKQESNASRPRWPVVAIALVAVGAIAALSIAFLGGDDNEASPATTGAGGESFLPLDESDGIDASTLEPGEILLEPIDVPTVHGFTDSVATTPEKQLSVKLPELPIPTTTSPMPDGKVALGQVPGNEPGLYGGTRDISTCDAEQLMTFLEAHPDKADAWAKVQGIAPEEITRFIKGLTPLTLTRDTRLTNHGFVDGKAVAHQSVLQAGHSVFVDEFGLPRAKCSCGNPLASPEPVAGTPTYVGTMWDGFSTTTLVVIVATTPVDGEFTIVDVETGELIVVPVGDRAAAETTETAATTVPPTVPAGEGAETELLNVGNLLAVTPGAVGASFTVDADTLITSIQNYHYGPESPPGQVGLVTSDGTMVGPWPTVGSDGQGGVANAYWTANPDEVIPPGTYTVWDSEPSTWSTNPDAGGLGFSVVMGVVGVDGG